MDNTKEGSKGGADVILSSPPRHHPAPPGPREARPEDRLRVRVIQFGSLRKLDHPDRAKKRDRVMTMLFIERAEKTSPGWPAPEERSIPKDAGHDNFWCL
jgi:hypothetical protein